MTFHLVQRRTIWCPTLLGWVSFVMIACAPLLLWWFQGESFLMVTQRQPAEVLVVEGWIGVDGLQAAKAEFEQGGYLYLVTAGGISYSRWDRRRWDYAEVAHDLLLEMGLPGNKIIAAQAPNAEDHRTYQSAVAVWRTLQARGIQPNSLNVFTLGAHARRSRLVFAKICPTAKVGVIAWTPSDYPAGPWWKSSERADAMIKETVGYLYEALLNSGRGSNAP